jgi:hypothetical protein
VPLLKERREYLSSHLSVHISRVYFLCYAVLFLETSGLYFVDKNTLNKGAMPHCELQLNNLLLLVEIQGVRKYSDPVRVICALYHPKVNHTDGRIGQLFYNVGTSAGMYMNLKIHCFYHLLTSFF